jgi:hypothetical protein
MSQSELLYCLALVLAGFGLFQWESLGARKAGVLCFCAASALTLWFLTGLWWMAFVAMALWILFPISEVIFVLRKLRVPRHRELQDTLPPLKEFPDLREVTQEFEALGYVRVEDCNLTPAIHDQFYRLMVHPEKPVHAIIGHIAHAGFGFHFAMFLSEAQNGRIWATWDYPLTYGLKMPPEVALHRVLEADSAADIEADHLEFLELNHLPHDQLVHQTDVASAKKLLEKTLEHQLAYNIRIGILHAGPASETTFRYSWRGTLYVAGQVLKDLVRM